MTELELKYGCNPNQKNARLSMSSGGALPLRVLCGRPGYINFLDALNSWQLVRELRAALHQSAAASFKHVRCHAWHLPCFGFSAAFPSA